jgi:hypothetical protein
MVIKGPGTIWESWTDSTNSHNHPALSADIGVYLYSLAGVEPVDRWGLGDNRRIVFELDAATARAVGSAAVFVSGLTGGRASFCWRFEEGVAQTTGSEAFELNVTIPHGEDAELHLPINPDHRCHNFDVGIEDRLSTVWSVAQQLTKVYCRVWVSAQSVESARIWSQWLVRAAIVFVCMPSRCSI